MIVGFGELKVSLLSIYSYMYDYEKEGYLGQEHALGTIDISCFMEKFRQVWKELERVSLKYIGKISRMDIKRLMLEEASGFLGIWFSMLRQYRREWLLLPSFQEIEKEEYFRVQIGELAYNGWDF